MTRWDRAAKTKNMPPYKIPRFITYLLASQRPREADPQLDYLGQLSSPQSLKPTGKNTYFALVKILIKP
jgi:hypothetical protein